MPCTQAWGEARMPRMHVWTRSLALGAVLAASNPHPSSSFGAVYDTVITYDAMTKRGRVACPPTCAIPSAPGAPAVSSAPPAA